MKFANLCLLALPLAVAIAPAHAGEPNLESMATCQDSWLEWKENPARGDKFIETLHANYTAKDSGYLVPKTKTLLFGLPVTRVYPESVGMGVGFCDGRRQFRCVEKGRRKSHRQIAHVRSGQRRSAQL